MLEPLSRDGWYGIVQSRMKMNNPPGASAPAEMACRVLIVDDDDAVRYVCAEALKEYDVLQAENGREALNLLAGNPVDVVLTDVMMPEMNGLELLETVREKEPNQIVIVPRQHNAKA